MTSAAELEDGLFDEQDAGGARRLDPRFDRLARLYGEEAVARLAGARVVIFGVGGVGSFAAEALARSAVGNLLLVDLDVVTVSNTNRQLQALEGEVGAPKALVLRDRLRRVNPAARIDALQVAYDPASAERLLTPPWPGRSFDFVVDCIDKLGAKAHLIATCRERGLPVVSSMGAGGKTDPTRIRVVDLGRTDACRLAHQLRKTLRQKHDFPRGSEAMGVAAVYSEELRHWPTALDVPGERCACGEPVGPHHCSPRHLVDGTAAFVTGAFGLACASHVVNTLVGGAARPRAAASVARSRRATQK